MRSEVSGTNHLWESRIQTIHSEYEIHSANDEQWTVRYKLLALSF